MAHVKVKARDKPAAQTSAGGFVWLTDPDGFRDLRCRGYTSLADSPEVVTAVNTIARLIGSMTIHLMKNTPEGDIRVQNDISRIVDIQPNAYMTRSNLIQWIVRTLYLEGNGNAFVLPRTERGRLKELVPIPAFAVCMQAESPWEYSLSIYGERYKPDRLLHFAINPDSSYPWRGTGCRVALSNVANNLKQAAETSQSFLASKWKPSIIVKVDAYNEELKSPEKKRAILDSYVSGTNAGEPWLIPAEQFDVKEVRPLTLADLALADCVKLDRQSVAAILGVPPFILGVGEFKREEWNNFISTSIMPVALNIEQVLTRGLLTDNDLFFRCNPRSLLNYSMDELVRAGAEMVDRMALRRNEWRDWVGLPPDADMTELLALENYIPADRLGDQRKLLGGEDN